MGSKQEIEDKLNKAAIGALYTSILQAVIRISSFVLNGIILRYVALEVLGVVNMRLMLLYNTVLFLSREPIRKACLSRLSQGRDWTRVFNLSWISVPIGLLCCIFLSLVWLSPTVMSQPEDDGGYANGVLLFCIGALVELFTEPLVILGQAHQYVTTKVLVEGASQLCKCAFTVVTVMWFPQWGITALSVANLSYSVIYFLLYYIYFYYHLSHYEDLPVKRLRDVLPKRTPGQPLVDETLFKLAWSFLKQSILKQLLTDGEKYLITYFDLLTFSKQGVYDVINNLGSLVPRFIFLPIEENFGVYFANSMYRGKPAKEQPESEVKLAAEVLAMLLKLVILVALVILTFGYSYSFLLLDIYGGAKLTSENGHWLLRTYCIYVLFLAVNGVTEGFTFAMMSKEHVDSHNYLLMFSSIVFLAASYILTKVCGSPGLILANCINMAVRIISSLKFINDFFSTTSYHPLRRSIPSVMVLSTFTVVSLITTLSEVYFCCEHSWLWRFAHVGVGLVCLCCLLVVTAFNEQDLLKFLYKQLPTKITSRLDIVVKYIVHDKPHSE